MTDLSRRLQAVADLILYDTVADIGTDHGYLPLYLWQQGRLRRGLACDVNRGPLQRGAENIARVGAPIETRLGSGLAPLVAGEVETAVLAGMGGMLMCRLLLEEEEKTKSLRQLVLQPQRDIGEVRKTVQQLGFAIEKEVMLWEDGHFYTAFSAVPGSQSWTETELKWGKLLLEEKNPVLKDYVTYLLEKERALLARLPQGKGEAAARCRELEEVLAWL